MRHATYRNARLAASLGRGEVVWSGAGGEQDAERVRACPDRGRQGQGPARAIRAIDGVQWADDLAGPHDVIARVQASGLDELGRLVVARIQAVDGVTRTLTCTVLHR